MNNALRLFCLGMLCVAIGISTSRVAIARPAEWKAGIAREVITPSTPVWLAGYGTKRPPDGKLHDLWMKALALEDPRGNRVVLVTSDFQGVPKSMSDRVFDSCQTKFGLTRQQLMITFSHNHCGPRLGDDLIDYYPVEAAQEILVKQYTEAMVIAMVDLIGRSLSDLSDARLYQGQGRSTFAVNRRNNREDEVPKLIAERIPLVGPTDHSVPVLKVARPDGQILVILFGYACHPTTLSFTTWCGDYPGFAQIEIEARYPGSMAMFVNTCGGDQNPIPRRTVELCEHYGHRLAVGVDEALSHSMQEISGRLEYAFDWVDLPYLSVVDREQLISVSRESNPIRARWAARMLKKLERGESLESMYPYPIHVWKLGREMLMIGMGAETVVDYALRFKREFGSGVWVCGYSDDMISYIPSRRVWDEGGYEGGSNLYEYGRPAFRWEGGIEDRISGTVRRLVDRVQSAEKSSPR